MNDEIRLTDRNGYTTSHSLHDVIQQIVSQRSMKKMNRIVVPLADGLDALLIVDEHDDPGND